MPKKKQSQSQDPYALLSITHPLLKSSTSGEGGDTDTSSGDSEDDIVHLEDPTEDNPLRSPQLKHQQKPSQSQEPYALLSIAHPLLMSSTSGEGGDTSSGESEDDIVHPEDPTEDNLLRSPQLKHQQKPSQSQDLYALLSIAHPLLMSSTSGDGVDASSGEREKNMIHLGHPTGDKLLRSPQLKHKQKQSQSQEPHVLLSIAHPLLMSSTSGAGVATSSGEGVYTSGEGEDNMIYLDDLTEEDLLRNLQLRHKHGIIYTYIGSVLVAVNPYKNLPIYSSEKVRLYHGRKLGELPPHIFAIAESCYSNMKRYLRNQCCIISGETGAGKTESTKLILQYLAAVSGELSKQQIEQQILESNPILEAFGNAKTVRNDNSSRFGKYVEIIFNKHGVIEGARMEQYLLEKSRVCHQALEERNYHIFYSMLAGITAEEKKTLGLGHARNYTFLTKGGSIVCEGRDDAEDYRSIHSAMKILTFSENERQEILKLLAAILHLGNVSFKANTQNNLETSEVSRSPHFSFAASLLGVHKSSLAASFTTRSITANSESVTKPLNSEQASDCRDAFVKAIYNKLFIWIVEKVNGVIHKRLTSKHKSSFKSIGLLDIFGFEDFDTNSFEQLCINFANEKLQQFFVHNIFKQEQEEYLKEEIKWKKIKFTDNKKILDLLAGKPCNVLALIDEESHFPKGTDVTMLQKMNQEHSRNEFYIAPKNEYDTDFGICHFAGVVNYDTKGFLEKNRDAISFDIIKMLDRSTSKLLREIFETELAINEINISNDKITMTPKNSLRIQSDNLKQVPTLSGQFRQSLDSLMRTLSACQPFFIRCIKPNTRKLPKVFDRELCKRQLRYSGIMDTVHIRKLGYPVRHTFEYFLRRYRVLLKTTTCNPKTNTAAACCEAICKSVIKKKDDWKKGRTKIFLKEACDAVLERLREQELNRKAIVIQRTMLGYKDRKSFLKKRRAALVLQRRWRFYKEVILPRRKLLHGYARLVSKIRSRRMHLQFQRQRAAALTLQSHLRGYWVRKDWQQKRQAAIVLQTHTTQMLDRGQVEMRGSSMLIEDDDSEDEDDESDDSNDEFSFYKFSVRHFQDNATHTHISDRLRKPLLSHDDESDAQACLNVWWIILRFMEDMPEPETRSGLSSPIARHMPRRQAKRLNNHAGQDQKILKSMEKFRDGREGLFDFPDEQENKIEDREFWFREDPALDQPLSSMEKVHIITEYALSRQDIRDEIYCQICKQLVRNKNKRSRMLGWTLLSICLGIFLPTDLFMRCLENFVLRGPNGYGEYCTERLRRIKANGERKEVPCWIEIEAAESREPVDVSVNLSDGRTLCLHLDPLSTSAEVCHALADMIDLRDTHGFSLFIGLDDKMWSLRSGGKHVFDAVSQFEQEMKRQGRDEQDTFWRLYLHKEVFTPWHNSSEDLVSMDLIYRQIIKGLKSGEYKSVEEDGYVDLAAKHYYIQFGSEYDKENMEEVVEECIPTSLIENKSTTKWIQLISSHLQTHLRGRYVNGYLRAEKVKEEVVDNAKQKWPLYFSESYEVTLISGPTLPKSRFIVAVNSHSILFSDKRDKKLLELPYIEIKEVHLVSKRNFSAWSVSLDTVRGEFVLKSDEAEDMAALLKYHLDGLRQRSVYALAQKDFSKPDDAMFLVCKQGDLLLVEKDGVFLANYDWIRATNQRTRHSGAVYRDTLMFLPTLSRPSDEVLELLNWGERDSVGETFESATLKEFSLENFRPAHKDVGRHGAFEEEKLWAHSRDPLKQPLLKSLVHNFDLSNMACSAFTAILKYMGDYLMKQTVRPVELTDQIFGPATKHEALQDEIYCQIIKQMTYNNNSLSMEAGWQLLWLCSGLFPPSHNLMRHAQRFVETRLIDQVTADCLQRMQEMRSKEPRKFPPHLLEVNAIQHNSTRIFQRVIFPNSTDEMFEVTTTTTIKELRSHIASQLKLNAPDDYGLYMETPDKLMHMEEQKYFFDYLRQTSDSPKKGKKVKEGSQASVVIFKKRLWVNVNLGEDLMADNTFHFPQELSEYLQGYHNCTKEDIINLSGLLLRTMISSDSSQFSMIPKMLKELVPADQIKSMSSVEWKKHIISSYSKQSGLSAQEAKIAFLRAMSRWPTFGSTFFEVRQTSELNYPYTILIAVSKDGVGLINPKTKKLLVMHPFSNIIDYRSRGDSFQMTTDTLSSGSDFVCETPNASTMEDLLKSYKSIFDRQKQTLQPKKSILSQRF